jgi:hypothetical protein
MKNMMSSSSYPFLKKEEKAEIIMGLTMDMELNEPSPTTIGTILPCEMEMFHREEDYGAQLQRPKGLTAVLNLVANSESKGVKKYAKFLQLADTAQKEIANACIAISTSYRCTTVEPIKKIISSSSLLDIFKSYSKIISPAFKLLNSPGKLKEEKAVIYINELLIFGRDFDLYPRLMTKDDMKMIYSVVSLRYKRTNGYNLRGLDFQSFKDYFIRLALFTYHKPVAKDLILRLNDGRMPCHLELVEYLCRYLRLDDQNFVTKQLLKSNIRHTKPERCTFGKDKITVSRSAPKIRKSPSSPKNQYYEGANAKALPFLEERSRINKKLQGIVDISKVSKVLPVGVELLFQNPDLSGDLMAESDEGEINNDMTITNSDEQYPSSASNMMTDEQKYLINHNLESNMLRCLEKYSCNFKQQVADEWFYPEGAFVDMGCLKAGTECVMNLKVVNRSSDEIYLDTTCRGFEAGDTRVITEPSAVVPGLTRKVQVLFTVEPGDRAVVGNIEILAACVRTGLSYSINCPIHYRVGPPIPERDDYPCTIRNIGQLLTASTGKHTITTLNFETKKIKMDGSERLDFMAYSTK